MVPAVRPGRSPAASSTAAKRTVGCSAHESTSWARADLRASCLPPPGSRPPPRSSERMEATRSARNLTWSAVDPLPVRSSPVEDLTRRSSVRVAPRVAGPRFSTCGSRRRGAERLVGLSQREREMLGGKGKSGAMMDGFREQKEGPKHQRRKGRGFG